jgi:hypothetical protein
LQAVQRSKPLKYAVDTTKKSAKQSVLPHWLFAFRQPKNRHMGALNRPLLAAKRVDRQ